MCSTPDANNCAKTVLVKKASNIGVLSMRLFVKALAATVAFCSLAVLFAAEAQAYQVSGTVTGLGTGKSITLLNNGGNPTTVTANGGFSFSSAVTDNTSYTVRIAMQPVSQSCSLTNATGTSSGAAVTNVGVTCVSTYTVSGSISGLTVSRLVLRLNNSSSLIVPSGATSFKFLSGLASGAAYAVTVGIQPPNFRCDVTNGSGVISSSSITNVSIACQPTYTVSGSVTGLTSGNAVLKLNGSASKIISSGDSAYNFATGLTGGTAYAVTVFTQPTTGINCSVQNGTGTISGANVTNANVVCSPVDYTISGTTSGASVVASGSTASTGNTVSVVSGSFSVKARYGDVITLTATKTGNVCSVNGSPILMFAADVNTANVSCTPNTYTISGSNDGATVIASGSTVSNTVIVTGGSYSLSAKYGDVVTLTASKTGYSGCVVGGSPVTVSGNTTANVSGCTLSTYTISGTTDGATVTVLGSSVSNTVSVNAGSYSLSAKYGDVVTLSATKAGFTGCVIADSPITVSGNTTANVSGCSAISSSSSSSSSAAASYTVGGSVSGLSGTLILENNGEQLTLTANGSYAFPTSVLSGAAYLVLINSQPTGQNCSIVNKSGTMGSANVINVNVTCVTSTFTIAGNVFGLTGTLKLQNNAGDEITVSANGGFIFPTALNYGSSYAVTVSQQPSGLTCQVISGLGTNLVENKWGVVVACGSVTTNVTGVGVAGGMSTTSFTVTNTRTNNGVDNNAVTACFNNAGGTCLNNLNFSFPAQLVGSGYYITPPTQTTNNKCVVTNVRGVVTTSAVATRVECAKPPTADFLYGVVGGSISGLAGSLTLQNGAATVVLTAGTTQFNFPAPAASGSSYDVTVNTQPTGQTCAVSNGSGVIPANTGGSNTNPVNDVTNVSVVCVSNTLASQISGTVTGLDAGKTVTLLNNGGDKIIKLVNGAFTFANRVVVGNAYAVTASQPSGQICTVTGGGNSNGTGTSPGGGVDITNITVTCVTDTRAFTIGGTLSGLTGSITLLNNGGNALTLGANGAFTFSAALNAGSSYNVSLSAQPSGQTCFLFNNSGTDLGANVASVSVACSTNTYQVGGSVTNLSGSGLVLQLGKQTLVVPSGNSSFAFNTSLLTGNIYSVFIANQPLGQTCSLQGANGVMATTNVTSIGVACANNGSAAYNVVLGRPTDSGITLSILGSASDWGGSAYIQYGTTPGGIYTDTSATIASPATAYPTGSTNPIIEVTLSGLTANTKYYYRVNYKTAAGASFVAGNEYSFTTQRAPGSTFSFGVQGDSHPERFNDKMFHAELYKLTMAEIAKRQPDLYFMLGDDFSTEKMVENFKLANFGANATFPFATYGTGHYPYSSYLGLTKKFDQLTTGEVDPAAKGYGAFLEQRRDYLGLMAHSTSLFTVSGNHEQAMYVNLGGIFNNNAVFAASARNKFYPGPTPVSVASFTGMGSTFYSGDIESFATGASVLNGYPGVDGDGLLRDYYAFEWGDALFITIDPYWHATSPVDTSLYSDAENTWAKSMGDAQYFWLKGMLERNAAAGANRKKYVFLFSHHINGSGRGGANNTMVGEWGGNLSGEFAANRQCAGSPGCLVQTNWPKPIHQLLVDTKDPTGSTIFFQAHDHTFARETVDGVVYQSVANPADNSYWSYNCSAYAPPSIPGFPAEYSGYGQYSANQSVVMPGAGYIHVTVSPQLLKLQYIRTYRSVDLLLDSNRVLYDSLAGKANGEAAFTYSLPAQTGDDLAANNKYTCKGDAPPTGYVFNRYSVGGTISGLGAGKYVTLLVNSGTPLTLSGNGSFTFPVSINGTYSVSVGAQPAGQTCAVTSGSGTTGTYPSGNNVSNVSVTCTP